MKKTALLLITALLILSSCTSKLEKFNNEHYSFKKEYRGKLDETFKNFMSFEKIELDKSLAEKSLKEVNLNLSEDNFNALLIDYSVFDEINEKPDALDLFNPITGSNIIYISRLLKDDEKRLFFLESIRKEDFAFENSSGPMMQYNEFLAFSKKIPETKYILINYSSKVILPQLSAEGFYKGEYAGTIVLYDFKTKKMLGSFDFSAANSDAIYESSTSSADYKTLYNDLNEQIELAVKQKLNDLYTISSYDLDGLEFVEYVESE